MIKEMNFCPSCTKYKYIVPMINKCIDCWDPCHICGKNKHGGRCPMYANKMYKRYNEMTGTLEEKIKIFTMENVISFIPDTFKYVYDEETCRHCLYDVKKNKFLNFDTVYELNVFLKN